MSDRQENATINKNTSDREFTVDNLGSNLAIIGILLNVKTLERCLIECIDKEMDNIVDTVEDRIQNAFLTAIDGNITPKIKPAFR